MRGEPVTPAVSHYPPTRAVPIVEKWHGVEVADPYRWLEHGDDPEVRAWTEAQNAFTRARLDPLPGRKALRDRLDRLLDIGTVSAPIPRQGRYFYLRRQGKQNQPVLYVRHGLDGAEQVLLDVNRLSAEGTVALDWWYPSPDGRYVAYGISRDGSEYSTLYVRDVVSRRDLPDIIERTRYCSLAWLPDSSGFYYTRYPRPGEVPRGEEHYHRHVFFHRLGDDPATDRKVFGSGRPPEDMPTVALSPDGRWLVVTEHQGWAKSEVYFKDLSHPESPFQPLVEGVEAVFEVVPRNDALYVRTNHQAPRYKLYRVDPLRPRRDHWQEVAPQAEDVLQDVAVVSGYLILEYLTRAHSRLELRDTQGRLLAPIPLPTLGSVSGLAGEWNGQELFFGFQSFTVPPSVYRVDLPKRSTALWTRIDSDLQVDEYVVQQVSYRSRDGTPVTMFLAHRRGLDKNGRVPTLLYGYGGFNISLTPAFSAHRFVFLERGGLLAVANLRGGGEYGEDWHRAGMLGNKQNVFDDFIAAAEWLIQSGYTCPERLAIQGGSNGGLLVGAALTQRPDLFRAVVCHVPLLDMLRYHKFLIARLWIPEYGCADDPEQFRWLYAYSPYHRVRDGQAYPATLILAAESDSRVDPLHARKMTARLQKATASDPAQRPILLRLETRAGHGQGKPRGKILDELTDVYAFVFWQLQMN
ncbi:MAG: S9 family peptidase [Gemmataceae bacterium]